MNQQKKKSFVAILSILLFATSGLAAQPEKTLTLSDVFRLAVANSKQLKLAQTGVEVSRNVSKVVESALLPSVDLTLSASYIGNVSIMDRNFSNARMYSMPHLGNNFAIDASQVIFSGGAISTSIEKARLEEQVAKLNLDRNELDICFLVTSYYLDLYKLSNQREVFQKNVEQTEMLIKQIQSKEAQGMALSSDVTRHELMLQNLKLALIEVDNNSKIINQQLAVTLGLPADTQIVPDPSVLEMNLGTASKDNLLPLALANLPELKSARLNKDIAAKDKQIAQADYYPQIALLAANHFDGPILVEVPTINSNLNYWYVGIGIKYNLASLYKNNRKVQLATKKQQLVADAEAIAVEHTQVAVQSAYLRLMESFDELKVYETSSRLASENYRIINNRYLNQAVLITEMLDASNTRLNADLELINAKLNVIYNYYKLQRETGTRVVDNK